MGDEGKIETNKDQEEWINSGDGVRNEGEPGGGDKTRRRRRGRERREPRSTKRELLGEGRPAGRRRRTRRGVLRSRGSSCLSLRGSISKGVLFYAAFNDGCHSH